MTSTNKLVQTVFSLGMAILAAAPALAKDAPDGTRRGTEFTVGVTNLTSRTWFAPLLVAVHPRGFAGFREGMAASSQLQAVAEIGDIAPLADSLPVGSLALRNPAGGPLKPGATAATQAFGGGRHLANTQLSVYAMLVPSNDGFIGLNAIDLPRTPGTYVYYLNAWDAGTEANDEAAALAPGANQPGMGLPPFLNDPAIDPRARGFERVTKEGFVHIHRGIVGSAPGGPSALDHSIHRWGNPVAKVTLTVR